ELISPSASTCGPQAARALSSTSLASRTIRLRSPPTAPNAGRARRQTSEAKARLGRTDGLIRDYSLGVPANHLAAVNLRDQIRDHRGSILEEAKSQREKRPEQLRDCQAGRAGT